MAKMDLRALGSILATEKADALAAWSDGTLSQERSDAMDYYFGRMDKDMPVQEGRSRAVSTDVADTVEGLMPSLMDIFCGSDEVVRFEPVGPEDEAGAQQETDYVNHVFMQQNPGFMVLYSFIKDCLLQKVGIVKVWWEETEEEQRETYLDQPDEAFALVAQAALNPENGLEIVEHTARDTDGVITHDVTLVTTKKKAGAKALGVPPEEFGIDRNARDIRTANYCFHEVTTRTEADLIAEGYDEEQVKSLESYAGVVTTEQRSRDSVYETQTAPGDTNAATRLVRFTEHYIRIDYEGKGRPCLYQVITGGEQGEILRRDGKECVHPWDMMPFAAITPVPVPHRFFGRSIADLVMDIQRIKTALVRGGLDNLYLHINPRVEVAETFAGPNTLDDLLVSRPGGIVRTKAPGGLNWQVVPDITSSIFPALEYWDQTREMRTGVTRTGQGVDANALVNQSATAVNQVFTMAQARMKLIARIIAETGVKDLFSLLHGIIRKHGQQAQTVRLRNQWVQVDPRNWKTRDDMTITVGLGNGGKAEQFAQMMGIANIQKEMLGGGKSNLVDDQKLFNTASQLTKLAGHKNPNQFFNDPSEKNQDGSPKYPPPPPPVDPKIVQIQTQAQLDAQADQRKAQIESVQAEADIATQNRKTEAEMVQSQQDYQLKRELAILDFNLQRELKLEELAMKREDHQQRMQQQQAAHEQAMQSGAYKMAQGQQAHEQKMEQQRDSDAQ